MYIHHWSLPSIVAGFPLVSLLTAFRESGKKQRSPPELLISFRPTVVEALSIHNRLFSLSSEAPTRKNSTAKAKRTSFFK
ncbi:hypothetical protein IW261DRAFT_657768 [Armillaria novae-zelandiae]|uniref:Uncharacterized protein n=1 Tax=Armillaria novae-zelandiae TaxID=153914 RepID=A0AA39PP71_9AGAR|nr:hypothetical protein IW261DRAFT_657768 [Armillaria novae-zelandiae]